MSLHGGGRGELFDPSRRSFPDAFTHDSAISFYLIFVLSVFAFTLML